MTDSDRLRELWAREQIRHTVAAYTIAGDSFRLEDLAAQFTEDGVLEVRGQETAHGRGEIVAMLTRHAAAGSPPDGATGFYVRHFVANTLIRELHPTQAHAVSYFLVVTPSGPDHWGRYRDEFRPAGDRWLLRHRTVRVDGSVPGGWYRRVFAIRDGAPAS
jgi:SnoaL-like domain